MTLRQFIEFFKVTYGVDVSSITADKYMVFSNYPAPSQET
jgi:ubiquitin-activating enzyme E1